MSRTFDAIIIGTGQAGPPLAKRLASAGMKVAIAERKRFGGTCVNTGCTPTKALVASARTAHVARRAADFGVEIEAPVRVDMKRVKARKDALVKASTEGVEKSLRETGNVTVLHDHARFEGPGKVRVGDELIEAERIFVNVGARARVPPMPGIEDVPYLTDSSIMEVDFLPEHLIVLGGGYVGLEFAQMYRRFGSVVTVIQRGPRLIPKEDEDVSEAVREILEGEGIRVITSAPDYAVSGAKVRSVSRRRTASRRAWKARTSFSPSGGCPTPTTSALTRRAWIPTTRAISRWMTGSAPMSRGSGLSATATGAVPSRIPPTTISRPSRQTCWTAPTGGSPTASRPTPSTSTRR